MAAVSPARPGDFNGDGYPDLAVGATNATVAGMGGAGAVGIRYGSATGLGTAYQSIDQSLPWVPDDPDDPADIKGAEEFGGAMESGDLNGDGYADLVVATVNETWRKELQRDVLMVLLGSPAGLDRGFYVRSGARYPQGRDDQDMVGADFDQDGFFDVALNSEVLYGSADLTSAEGARLQRLGPSEILGHDSPAAGDITGDGYPDLVAYVVGTSSTGLVLYRGGPNGLSATPAQYLSGIHWDSASIGDLDGDGFGDLALGRAGNAAGSARAGTVGLWYGSSRGLDTVRRWTTITQDTAGVPDVAEDFDLFGAEVELADTTGDGYADLAIGAPGESVGTVTYAGSVTLIRGGAAGPNFYAVQQFTQDTANVPDVAEAEDYFGDAISFHDFDLDGRPELVVSASHEDGSLADEGAVHVLRTTTGGLTGVGSLLFGPRATGIAPEHATFGSTLDG